MYSVAHCRSYADHWSRLILPCPLICNQGVGGSIPSAGTIFINNLRTTAFPDSEFVHTAVDAVSIAVLAYIASAGQLAGRTSSGFPHVPKRYGE